MPIGSPMPAHAVISVLCTALLGALPAGSQRGWLGVMLDPDVDGVRIGEVVPGSPAAAAGLQAGDHIVALGGVRVREPEQLAAEIRRSIVGDRVRVRLLRGAAVLRVEVVLGRRLVAMVGPSAPPSPRRA